MINKCLTGDDDDIYWEIRCLFVRTSILMCKFSRCSLAVKLVLFRSVL